MVNVPLLEAGLQAIKDHPELHEQSSYFAETECGTAMCYAGWVCHLMGYERVFPIYSWSSSVHTPDGPRAAGYAAAEALGISLQTAEVLYHGANTVDQLEQMVKDLVNTGDVRERCHYVD
jgi:hypothetical protein